MTEQERKLFLSLKEQGWFSGEEEPEMMATFDLSEKRLAKFEPKDQKKRKKRRKTPPARGTRLGVTLCEGYALIYRDSVAVWQEGILTERIPIGEGESLTCEIGEGSVSMLLGEKVLFVSRLKQKTAYYLLAKRFDDLCLGKEVERESDRKVKLCIKCSRPMSPGESGEVCSRCRSKKRILKQLWDVMTGSRLYIATSIILFFVVTGVNLIAPYLHRILVDTYIEPGYAFLEGFAIVILSILAANLLSRGISIVRSRILINASNGVIIRLRDEVFEKVENLSVSNIQKRTAGNLMHRINNDTSVIQNFLTNQFSQLVEQLLMFLGVGVILFVYDWKLALLIIGPMPLAFFLNLKFRRRVGRIYHTQWEKSSQVDTFLHDIFSGIRVVKSFGTEERENKRFDALTYEECRIRMRNERFFAVFSPILTFLLGIGEIFLLYYTGYMNLSGDMTLGTISMFSSYVGLIYGPLQFFGRLLRSFSNMLNSASKVFEILDEKVDVADTEAPIVKPIEGTIELKNVAFDYDERNAVLKNVNLTVKPGEMIGIVGKSGVGKSTLINLVMRMYDVDEGEILIDGINIKEYSQESLRSQIGAVLQETFLFSGSIYDNIAYAKPNATREEVIAAAKVAGAHRFIIKLPDGYNTKVGERGYTLSGGERQRVTIARALLHDPRILILDEATSALDTETEKQIQDALQILIKNRTTLAIAHRLSTLRNATRLIVLSEGTIAEEGTHEELMAKKGMYYDLVMAQRQMFSTKKES
ncbi:MAG: ABC transporter ATP-binding protein [Clostridia bacterium]|nr:ABC transporter ATP-binding protein [Clostridia bacterium]